MATDIDPAECLGTLGLENDKFARNDNNKIVVRVEDESAGDLLDQILAALGGGSTAVWSRFGPLVIPASSTVVVDTNLLDDFSRIDYILNFKNDPTTVTRSLKLVVQNSGGNVTDMVSERMGGSIDVNVNVPDDGLDAFLEIVNNEAFDVTINFLRAITP